MPRRLAAAVALLLLASCALVPSAFAATARVTVRSTKDGSVLVDGHGKSLYMFGPDSKTKSACSGACAQNWPPLVTSGKPKAGSGVSAKKLKTIKRSNGKMQVTYAGHPLYGFIADAAAGDVNGQGLNAFGGLWSLLTPSGSKVTGTGSSAPPSMPAPTPSPTPTPTYPY